MARPGTGYAHPIIGWRDQLSQLKPEQARSWYQRFYVPGQIATLVIAGDVTEDQARSQVEKFFGAIPAGETPHGPSRPSTRPPVSGA